MSKLLKRMLGVIAVGSAVAAGTAYYLKKKNSDEDFLDEFDEEFDAAASSDREYVPLTPASQQEETAQDPASSEEADTSAPEASQD